MSCLVTNNLVHGYRKSRSRASRRCLRSSKLDLAPQPAASEIDDEESKKLLPFDCCFRSDRVSSPAAGCRATGAGAETHGASLRLFGTRQGEIPTCCPRDQKDLYRRGRQPGVSLLSGVSRRHRKGVLVPSRPGYAKGYTENPTRENGSASDPWA